MEYEIYIDTARKQAFASLSPRAAQANATAVLQSHLKFSVYFFDSTADTPAAALLDESATFRIGLKPASNPESSALIYASSPSATGDDHYDFEWNEIDSTALRTLLGKSPNAACLAEIAWTIGSLVERVSWPVCVANANLRNTDGPPNPMEDASDTFVAERALCFDRAQTLTGAQRMQALANLGITFVNGALRVVLENGDIVHAGLTSGEPPSP